MFHKREALLYESYSTNANETKKIQLRDGSEVLLNRKSKLLVPRFNFGESLRVVELIGEAKFAIKHTHNHMKFIVNTPNGVKITVLGTVFDVYAFPKGTRVELNEGSVQLNFKEGAADKQLLLAPGDQVTVSDDRPLEVGKINSLGSLSTVHEKKIVFNEAPLFMVLSILESNYGIPISVPDSSLLSLTITGTFPVDNVQELMNMLVEGAGLKLHSAEDGGRVLTVD
jgi:ferric-dicitrate binding protein FerR (iron transport regulator)